MDHSETDTPAEVAASTPPTDGPATAAVEVAPSASPSARRVAPNRLTISRSTKVRRPERARRAPPAVDAALVVDSVVVARARAPRRRMPMTMPMTMLSRPTTTTIATMSNFRNRSAKVERRSKLPRRHSSASPESATRCRSPRHRHPARRGRPGGAGARQAGRRQASTPPGLGRVDGRWAILDSRDICGPQRPGRIRVRREEEPSRPWAGQGPRR